jgi:uncharacterized protein YfaS (alpha-2-macroglobulin family)
MLQFVHNILILDYLKAIQLVNRTLQSQAISNLQNGYQRMLAYKSDDGAYSIFGNNEISGSIWFTALVVKSFVQAKEYIYVDEVSLEMSLNWIKNHQREDGCFSRVGDSIRKVNLVDLF